MHNRLAYPPHYMHPVQLDIKLPTLLLWIYCILYVPITEFIKIMHLL